MGSYHRTIGLRQSLALDANKRRGENIREAAWSLHSSLHDVSVLVSPSTICPWSASDGGHATCSAFAGVSGPIIPEISSVVALISYCLISG